MKPDNEVLLRSMAQALAGDIIPQIPTSYGRADAALMVEILLAVAGDLEGAASRIFEENRALRTMFSKAFETVKDERLKKQLLQASETSDDDIRISSLEESNQKLSALLIELHEHVEGKAEEEIRGIEMEVWKFLSARTMNRMAVVMATVEGKAMANQDVSTGGC